MIDESALNEAIEAVRNRGISTLDLAIEVAIKAYLASLKAVAETDANAPGDTSLVSGVSSAPNHQPHAVSQGWRDDMENAPSPCLGVCVFPNDGPTVRIVYRRVWHGAVEWTTHGIAIRATHWMPLPAPPSPAKTGGVE